MWRILDPQPVSLRGKTRSILEHAAEIAYTAKAAAAGDVFNTGVRRFHASEDAKFALATLGNDAGLYSAVSGVEPVHNTVDCADRAGTERGTDEG